MKRLDQILRQMRAESGLSPDATGTSSGAEPALSPAEGPAPLAGEEPACALCGDAGFVRKDVPFGHADFGKAFPCQCVLEEAAEQRLRRLQRYSNLGPLTRLTFANLVERGRPDRIGEPAGQERFAQAVKAAQEFSQEPAGWLAFCSPSGGGKTHLAAAIANRCLEQGYAAFFVVVPDLLDRLRAAYSPESEIPYDEMFEQVRNAPLVIMDDLGAHSATPWAKEKLFQIINHRYNLQLPTVFTIGVPLEELDERLRTRLGDAGICRLFLLEAAAPRYSGAFGGLSLPIISAMTFDSFLTGGQGIPQEAERSLRNALRMAKTYAEGPEGWLVLLGRTGCGKTHLAAATGHYLHGKGVLIEFCVVPDLLELLRSAMRDDVPAGRSHYEEIFEAARTSPFLILDDLGVHSATPWAQEKLFQILNYRYNAKLPTVITIGCPLDELPEAWVSRMSDAKVSMIFEIEAPDYRTGQERLRRGQQRQRGRPRA